MPCIAYYRDGFPAYKDGDEERLFGKDGQKVLKICIDLCHRYFKHRDDGYPMDPSITNTRRRDYETFQEWKEAMKQWQDEHPNEMAIYNDAINEWNAKDQRLLRKLYGIAKHRHLRIEWGAHGSCVCYPDRFYIYRKGDIIAMVQC